MRGNVAAIVLILAGSFMLLTNLRTWWPMILIVVGIGLFFTPDRTKK